MATANLQQNVSDYARQLVESDPKTALEIAIQETERTRALAAKAAEEYRAMSELEFDAGGKIIKANMAGLWRLAKIYADSKVVPKQYQGNVADCFIACQMAFRCKVDPFAYMQNSYVVPGSGKPAVESKLAIAMLNMSGCIKGRIRYRLTRDEKNPACTAFATDANTGEEVEATVDWNMVVAEGWLNKNGSKWKTMPDVMFHYRAGLFLIRRHYPEVLMGMQTKDELEDIGDPAVLGPHDVPRQSRSLADLTERLNAAANGNGNTASELDAQEAAKTAQTETAEQTSTDPGELPPFDGEAAVREIEACTTISQVADVVSRLAYQQDDDTVAWLDDRGEMRRDAIRASRGQKKES